MYHKTNTCCLSNAQSVCMSANESFVECSKSVISFHQILHAAQTCLAPIVCVMLCDLRGVQIPILAVLGSDHHIFQSIGTKFHILVK